MLKYWLHCDSNGNSEIECGIPLKDAPAFGLTLEAAERAERLRSIVTDENAILSVAYPIDQRTFLGDLSERPAFDDSPVYLLAAQLLSPDCRDMAQLGYSARVAFLRLQDFLSAGTPPTIDAIRAAQASADIQFSLRVNGKETTYSADTLIGLLFADMDYLLSAGYKISKCDHCGRTFAVKTLKTRYCPRNSTFPGYERYACADAVKHINDALEKRRLTVYQALHHREEYPAAHKKSVYRTKYPESNNNAFLNACADYKNAIRKHASIALLSEYKQYLYQDSLKGAAE